MSEGDKIALAMENCAGKTDQEVVKLALKDGNYFECLIERYEAKIKRYVMRICSVDSDTAEDISQEVFVKVFYHLNDYDGGFSFSVWIYRIAHNMAIDFIRKNGRFFESITNYGEDGKICNLILSDEDLPENYQKQELVEMVRKSLYSLPEKYRDVLVLRYLEDKSYEEIGDILRKSVNSVSILLSRGKKLMKDRLKFKL
jgi:RNA polymerase sigma-70 factor (ECF subfamily)